MEVDEEDIQLRGKHDIGDHISDLFAIQDPSRFRHLAVEEKEVSRLEMPKHYLHEVTAMVKALAAGARTLKNGSDTGKGCSWDD